MTEDPEQHRAALKAILRSQGIRAALQFINQLSPHRFTALYRFSDRNLINHFYYDRTNPAITRSPDNLLENSYCIFLKNSGKSFSLADSTSDDRVREHPKRMVILSYIGVPLITSAGDMIGSVCNFDPSPYPDNPLTLDLLETLAGLLAEDHFSFDDNPEPDPGVN